MRRVLVRLVLLAIGIGTGLYAAKAQLDAVNPVPGGATAANAVCIQYGDLDTGIFMGTFLQTGQGAWEQRVLNKPDLAVFKESKRDDEVIELLNEASSVAVQFEFSSRKIKDRQSGSAGDLKEINYILNATDKESAKDCLSVAKESGPLADGSARPDPQPLPENAVKSVMISLRPGTTIKITPGTRITATEGPAAPGIPGFFLCPNGFSVRPEGGVCCRVGACGPGEACSAFGIGICLSRESIELCPGTLDPKTGIALQCAPGIQCNPGPCKGGFCCP